MFEYLYEWIQNLAFYLVLITAVIHMIPESGYKKYIHFFTGLVLILMILTPVLKLFGMDSYITDIYNNPQYKEFIEKVEQSGDTKKMLQEYSEEMIEEQENIEVEEIQIGQEE